jgi:DNA-directed RNA polymerase specialized sigma24 family protein
MSALGARSRHESHERERKLISLRGSVTAAVVAQAPSAGSAAIADAVDEALAQLVAADQHLREPGQVKQAWILCARHRIIDELQSAASRRRAPVAVDDLAQVLTLTASGDLASSTEESRTAWRVRELLSQLRGDQRRWAEAWYDEILAGSLPPGGQPRGLAETLGWEERKTKSVAYRARKRMVAFANERASGAICEDRRASLDDFIRATANLADDGIRGALDQARYEQILFHIAGCEDCWVAWHVRRRSLGGRFSAILILPLSWSGNVARLLRAKLATLVGGTHAGAGAAGAAVAGGGAASLSANTGGICVGVVCAAGAGAGALAVVPSILGPAPRHASHHSIETALPTRTTPARRVPPPAVHAAPVARPQPSATYVFSLAATGPPAGSAHAALRIFRSQDEICWTFSKLAGLQDASSIELRFIGRGANGQPLLMLGPYEPKGCLVRGGPGESYAIKQIDALSANVILVINTGHGAEAAPRLRSTLPSTATPTAATLKAARITLVAKLGGAKSDAQHAVKPSFTARLQLISPRREICWRFSHLTGLKRPKVAYIEDVRTGSFVMVTVIFGLHYRADGCVSHLPASTVPSIATTPGNYSLLIGTAAGTFGATLARNG